MLKTVLSTTLTKNIYENNYLKKYLYYDCNKVRPEQKSTRVVTIQNKLLQRVAHRPVMQKKILDRHQLFFILGCIVL